MGLEGGLNTYGYVDSNPLRYIDPEGNEKRTVGQRIVDVPEGTPLVEGQSVLAREPVVNGVVGLATLAAPPLFGLRLCPLGAGAKSGIDDLLKAGLQLDKNGLTKAGRALQKHGDRAGSVFPKSSGNAASRNQQGQDVLEGILKSTNQTTRSNRFGGTDIFDSNTGRGVRFDGNGNMRGFLDP